MIEFQNQTSISPEHLKNRDKIWFGDDICNKYLYCGYTVYKTHQTFCQNFSTCLIWKENFFEIENLTSQNLDFKGMKPVKQVKVCYLNIPQLELRVGLGILTFLGNQMEEVGLT